ncbi:hypothetical protein JXB31_04170 [Candidatus Woesearchaeota archaeon]|nr:hypothetical protein [Candidatus Woesearchaeota archaeon]
MPQTIGKKHQYILFTLGRLYSELNSRLKDRHLRIAIPKYVFIELVQKANITEKKARALYRNLETLEKKKLISYKNSCLALTDKGDRLYLKIRKEHEPFIRLSEILNDSDLMRYSRKSQTVFRFEE